MWSVSWSGFPETKNDVHRRLMDRTHVPVGSTNVSSVSAHRQLAARCALLACRQRYGRQIMFLTGHTLCTSSTSEITILSTTMLSAIHYSHKNKNQTFLRPVRTGCVWHACYTCVTEHVHVSQPSWGLLKPKVLDTAAFGRCRCIS